MAVHEIALRRRETVAEGTVACYFDKPAGFGHQAGQNAVFTFPRPTETDAMGPGRTFTLASAPHEDELMIATRLRDSAFKRMLRSAPLGTRLRLDGPGGAMVLHGDAARPAVFLAGGIGVTPFLSMARHAARERLPHRIVLFYSNRRLEDAAFVSELRALERRNPHFRLVATLTQAETLPPAWEGEKGPIRPEMLARHLGDLKAPVYYSAGPHAMTMSMEIMLGELGVSEDDMRSEEFYGY